MTVRLALMAALMLPLMAGANPASANVSQLVLHRRNCQGVTAYAVYDAGSVGSAPFFAVFQADLDGDGVFGEAEAGEPTRYARLDPALGSGTFTSARLGFSPVPEGTAISVTVYEVDSTGRVVSGALPAVKYLCTNRSVLTPLPEALGAAIPGASVVARITADAVQVYAAPNAQSGVIGGLVTGQQVTAIARNRRGDWVKVVLGEGVTGWLMWQTQAYLFGAVSRLPVE